MARRPPTSHDVARRAGVSQPTVSRALRDDPSVAVATRLAVHEAAAALGYVPSQRGRSLSTRRTGQVGVVISDLANPFYLEILEVVHDELGAAGQRMLVLTPDEDDDALLRRLLDGALDGAILSTTLLGSSLPQELARRSFPFVLLNRAVDDPPGDVVVMDNAAGGALAARALLDAGHREIAALFGPPDTSTGRDREAGFRAALAEAGLDLPEERMRRGPFDFAYGHAAALELATSGATALFCGNDVIAVGAYNGLRSAGVDIPGDMSLIGFDDIALASWEVFRLTTVRQDIREMVRRAVGLVLDRVADPDTPPRRVVLEPELVRRATLAPPAGHALERGDLR
jgi:LacI family transcriptional regulator